MGLELVILWGLYHGLFSYPGTCVARKKLEKLPGFVGWGYTVTVVFLGWILFRAEIFPCFFLCEEPVCPMEEPFFFLHILTKNDLSDRYGCFLFAGVLQKIYEAFRENSGEKSREWNGDSSENDRIYSDFSG